MNAADTDLAAELSVAWAELYQARAALKPLAAFFNSAMETGFMGGEIVERRIQSLGIALGLLLDETESPDHDGEGWVVVPDEIMTAIAAAGLELGHYAEVEPAGDDLGAEIFPLHLTETEFLLALELGVSAHAGATEDDLYAMLEGFPCTTERASRIFLAANLNAAAATICANIDCGYMRPESALSEATDALQALVEIILEQPDEAAT